MISKILTVLIMIREFLEEIFFPGVCPFCERPWHRSFRRKGAGHPKSGGICPACRAAIAPVREPYCLKCGKTLEDERAEFCYDCAHSHHSYEEGRALYPHTGPVKRAVYDLKYAGKKCYGEIFGREMAGHFKDWIGARQIALILPVPLHKKRLNERGYNQAGVIAKALAAELKGQGVEIAATERVLSRKKETKRLKTLGVRGRQKMLEGVFEADLSGIPPAYRKNVLLIDDIYTTGSTIDEAARALKSAGAEKVYFLTVTIGLG